MLTLSSDFGSAYPAAMKGVIARLSDARMVDVAHDLPRQDVRASAFWLDQVLPYFPPAVHLAVVDPGVGTERAAIAVRAGEHALVGPDNGVLLPAARSLAGDAEPEVFEIPYDDESEGDPEADHDGPEPDHVGPDASHDQPGIWPNDPSSSTFHGRDVFAPAAALVHEAGVDGFDEEFDLPRTDGYESIDFPEPSIEDDGAVGEALAVDGFGNVITNVPGDVLAPQFGSHVKVNGVWASARKTYAAVEEGHRVVTVGSHGNVELAVNRGRGDETFGVDAGGRIRLSW